MTPHRSLSTAALDGRFLSTASDGTASVLPGPLSVAVAVAALAATAAFVVVVWRRRTAPTAKPLLGVSLTMFVCPFTYLCLLLLGLSGVAVPVSVWSALVLTAVLVGTWFWFLFAVQYTGRGRTLTRLVLLAGVAFWMLFVASGVLYVVADIGGQAPQTTVLGALTTGLFFVSALGVVGALLVLETALERNAVRLPEAATLAAGALTFVFAPVAAGNLERPALVLPLLAAASGAFVVTVRRYPVFETLPAARITGRDRLFEAMDDAVVVVDRAGQVADLNPAASDAFDTDRASALDRPAEEVLPGRIRPAEVVAAETPVTVRTGAGETLAFSGDDVTDDHGRTFGSLLVGRNVTERRRRERRLSVLGHLLTDELRAWSDAVADGAASVSSGSTTDVTTVAGDIQARTDRMQALVTRVREIEQTLASGDGGRTDLSTLVPAVVDSLDVPALVRTPGRSVEAAVEEPVVRSVLESLLTAARPQRTRETSTAGDDRDRQDALTVDVIANPPNAEIHVVERRARGEGRRTALAASDSQDHPSGRDAAVAVARVAVEHAGGSVSVTRTDTHTVRAVLRFPAVGGGSEPTASDRTEGGEPP